GAEVALLALFNTPAPGCLKDWPLNRLYLTKRVGHELRKLNALPAREKVRIICEKSSKFAGLVVGTFKAALSRRLSGLPRLDDNKQTQRFLNVSDINVAAAKVSRPRPSAGRITLFLTEEVPTFYSIDPKEGWMVFAADGVEVHQVAGDNTSLFDARYV